MRYDARSRERALLARLPEFGRRFIEVWNRRCVTIK
jgi:hypothetical protein